MRRLLPAAFVLLALPYARADELTLKNGTVIRDCLVRDEGRVVRVWLRREDFPEHDRAYPRAEVQGFRIQRGPEWDAHEDLPDLSVTHLELQPALVGLHGVYDYDETGAPRLVPRLHSASGSIDPARARAAIPELGDANRLAPGEVVGGLTLARKPGDEVTVVAHVRNSGFAAAPPFRFVWWLNGEPLAEGEHASPLAEMAVARFTTRLRWPGGDPVLRFRVLPATREIATFNDQREETISGWGFDFLVTRRRVDYMHRYRNTLGSFSWEDYYQWHVDLMNRLFAQSVYRSAPQGIEARVRVNRIVYLDEVDDASIEATVLGADGLVHNQGAWHFRDSEEEKRGNWWRPDGNFNGCVTEWSLPHELGHQLGLVDLYNWDYHGRDGFPVDGRAQPLRFAHFFRHPRVMMHWHGPHVWHETSAEYLNRSKDKPRGIFGDYVFQTPASSALRVLDVNGRPLAGADVRIFQRATTVRPDLVHEEPGGVRWFEVVEDGDFPPFFKDTRPVIEGRTDAQGVMELPNRPVRPCRTLNGYERRPNPFGNMNVVGGRGLMLALVSKAGRTNPFWLELVDFNLACIRGERDRFVLTLPGDFPSADGPPPPALARLARRDDGGWRLHWSMPDVGENTTERDVHRFRIYRRLASEGLDFEPWDPVATVTAEVRSFDLPGFPDNPTHAVGAKRHAYGIASVNERGETSGVVELFAPRLDLVSGLVRNGRWGEFFLTLDGEVGLVKLDTPGRFEDWTPVGGGLERNAERFAVAPDGRMASSAWDRHAVDLHESMTGPTAWLGEAFRAGSDPGDFRHPRGVALDEAGNLAVADGDNRRVQIFVAEDVWGRSGRIAAKPRVVIDRVGGEPFAARIIGVALGQGLCLVHEERGNVLAFGVDLGSGSVVELGGAPGVGNRISMAVEGPRRFLVLQHDQGELRRYLGGRQVGATNELGGESLVQPRGLVRLADGRLAVFNALDHLLIGSWPGPESSPALPPELSGPYEHPRRWDRPQLRPKILVLNYEPHLPGPDGAPLRLTELRGWGDPRELSEQCLRELRLLSGGFVDPIIAEWQDIDGFPEKIDGFRYSKDSYAAAAQSAEWHRPDGMDYAKLVAEHRLAERVAAGEIDEVWLWGGPWFGYFESRMVGPGAWWCNSPGLELPAAGRKFLVMGFNYERGLAEMIHDFGHRLESTMARIYARDFGGWQAEKRRNDWERFSAADHYVAGWGAVGNCHYPCNGESDYDYGNSREVMSSAEDWLHYPALTGRSSLISARSWTPPGGDAHLGYLRWLFRHLPRAPGRNAEGTLCNWWLYLFDLDTWAETR